MKLKSIFLKPKAGFPALIALALLVISCGDDDTMVTPDPEVVPVVISFTASTPSIDDMTGTTAGVTFFNTSTGDATQYVWSFGDIATPSTAEVTDTSDQIVVYTLTDATQDVQVSLEGRNSSGEVLGTTTATVTLPAAIAMEEEAICGDTIFTSAVTFENGEEFFTFGGTTFAAVPNPDPSGANPEVSTVGQITNSGAAFEGSGTGLSSPVNFMEDDKRVRFLFWSTVEVPLTLQFVNGVNGERGVEAGATHSGSGWEEIVIDYANAVTVFLSDEDPGGAMMSPTGQYGQVVFFIDGPGTTAGDFFIDDLGVCGEGNTDDDGGDDDDDDNDAETVITNPISFESGEQFFTFGGTSFQIVANPSLTGENPTASMVGQITNSGANFEGTGIEIPSPFADFSNENKVVSFLFFSEVEVPLTLQFTNGVNGERSVETFATHSGSGWEKITLDYNDAVTVFLSDEDPGGEALVPDGQYGQLVLFIDGPGETAGNFFIDDIGVE